MNPWHIDTLHLTLRLLMAVVFGGLIGFEREMSNSAAGLRTHILVCVGSTLVMLISIYGFADFVNEVNVRIDPSRLAAQVITGVGFLGAGTILTTGNVIKGLTTAASVWVVASMGLAIGAGFYYPAAVAFVLVILSLWVLNKAEKKFIRLKKQHVLKLQIVDHPGLLAHLSTIITNNKADIRKMNVDMEQEGASLVLVYTVMLPRGSASSIVEQLAQIEGVQKISIE
ncbi:MgtC/SapB family protein [Paenibacillus albiflavus]|uniref:MgtC/SapB family protein n=1 Tax=Paenibacillus albiflavus TaxID=2545760 RepID=A0A4R4E6T0_9BACL|nr:MgtC/SapB family protein [Paenibacillus albiflavus]TCZ73405.1 MgtC/SapB family protein [Paenibacillus albiflavus]